MKLPRVVFAFIMSVLGLASQLLAAPTISTQPADKTVVVGAAGGISFTVAATGTGALGYQWEGSTDGGATWGSISNTPPFNGATTNTLNVSAPTPAYSGAKARCVVTDSADSSTITSNVVTLTITSPAPALILASPTNRPAFQGDVLPTTFTVVATGTGLTYQWQLSTDNGSTFPTTLTDTGAYSGTTTATLSIADPYANLGEATGAGTPNKYRCKVTSSVGSYQINSRPAALTIYATPAYTPGVTLKVGGTTASTIVANDPSAIAVEVSGVPGGGGVRIGRYGDLNGNGVIDPGEPLVQSFVVTDGAVTSFGGVTDPDIPGDTDATSGTISANFYLAKAGELARGAGAYIFRVSSPTGAFKPVDSSVFTVTQPTLAYTVSGTVNDGATAIPYAQVALLQQGTNGGNVVNETVADGSGAFTLQAEPGTYQVLALAPGYVVNMATAPAAVVSTASVSGLTLSLAPAAYLHTLTLVDQANPNLPLRGAQIIFQSESTGNLAIANTDNNGVAVAGAQTAPDWVMDFSSQSLAALGYLRPQYNNGLPLSTVFLQYPLRAANAMIYGTLTDNATPTPNPLANVKVNAGDQGNIYSADTLTDATGHYYLPIYSTGASNWNVQVDNQDILFDPSHVPVYVAPSGQFFSNVAANSANSANFVATVATASLAGTATKGGVPQSGLRLDLYKIDVVTTFGGSVTTDGSGNFNFALSAGTWAFSLSNSTNNGTPVNPTNIVGPVKQYTVNDGDHVTGITYLIVDSTGTIEGTITDFNGAPLSNANVNAGAVISTVAYSAGAQTDGSGHYSFPVIAGDWTVNANWSNLMFPQAVVTAGTGSNIRDFSPTVISFSPSNQSGIMAGSSAGFSAGVNNMGVTAVTMQWEVNSGSGWASVPDAAPYFGVTGTGLSINPASLGLSGNQYQLAVTFTYNSVPHTEYSTAATLTVSGTAPAISSQPLSATITAMGGTSFIVGAYGTPSPSYQWQFSTDGGSSFNNLSDDSFFSGTQLDTLVVNGATTALNGYKFQCVVSNGVNPNVVSDAVTLTVNPQTQVITFNDATIGLNTATDLSLLASTTSGLPLTFGALSANTTYTLVGTTLTITAPGYVIVNASAGSNGTYGSGSKSATFTVNKLTGSVTLGNLSATYDGTQKSASATTTPVGGLTVNFTYNGSGTPPTEAGPYTVVGTISDATYQGSATDTFTINKAGQAISFPGPGDQTYSETPLTLSASGGASGNPVTFALDSGPANLSGTNNSTLTLTGTGTVTVRASQAGSSNYNAATDVVSSFVVSPAATGFSAWQIAKFTNDEIVNHPELSGPTAIYGQDGLPNLVKYALGLEPKQNITTGLPVVTTTATDWVYTYLRPDSITDVTYTVQYSTDLTTWTPLADTFVTNAGGFDTRRATYALGSATRIYFRLNITQP